MVPFLKVNLGLAAEQQDNVQLMKPIGTLDDLLERARRHRIFGTDAVGDPRRRSAGISAIVDQQFGYADRIRAAGLVPIMEPEVSIVSPHKEQAETIFRDAIAERVEACPGTRVMVKITIPTQPGLYGGLAAIRASSASSRCPAATAGTRPAPCWPRSHAHRQLLPRAARRADG